jgi:hypothetical protein
MKRARVLMKEFYKDQRVIDPVTGKDPYGGTYGKIEKVSIPAKKIDGNTWRLYTEGAKNLYYCGYIIPQFVHPAVAPTSVPDYDNPLMSLITFVGYDTQCNIELPYTPANFNHETLHTFSYANARQPFHFYGYRFHIDYTDAP